MRRAAVLSSFAATLAFAWASPALAQTEPEAQPAPEATEPAPPLPEEPSSSPPPRRKPRPGATSITPDEAAGEPAPTVIVADPVPPVSHDRPAPEGPLRHDLVRINAGLRVGYLPVGLTGYMPSRGFDTFASSDVLTQFSIDGTYPLLTSGKLVLATGLGWDVGGRSDKVRGFDSSLTAHRLYVPVEGRYHLAQGLYLFGKVSPGAVAALASVKDPSAPNDLSVTGWAFSADASIGGSILLGPRKQMDKRSARFWLTPEFGYAYTTNASLRANPNRTEKDLLGSDEDTNLGTVAFSGIFWRASVGMTF